MGDSTHSNECYQWHHECASILVERLRAEVERLETENKLLYENCARRSPMTAAGQGRDACGLNHDEMISATTDELHTEVERLRAAIKKYVASRAFQGVCDEECELEAALKDPSK